MITPYLKEEEVNGIKMFKTFAKIDDLKLDPNNPKDIDEDSLNDLMDFISKYGALSPLLVDTRPERDGFLLGGNQRLKAYKRLGYTEVWIEFRFPGNDAEAFEIATLHNMEFGHYLETKLKEQANRFKDELDLNKLKVGLTKLPSLEELLQPNKEPKAKYELIIKCNNEQDLGETLSKLNQMGISAKARR